MVGVAIGLPEPYTSELQGWRERLGDPNAHQIPPHVTLLPPTALQTDDLAAVEEHLQQVASRHEPFLMHLRGSGTFRPVSPVVFVNLVEGISQTEQLAEECRRGPLALELDYPYHPHVTVAHHLDDPTLDRAFEELAGFDCRFGVTDFHLYVHEGEAGWQARSTFVL